jgi:hypothetical protein
MAFDSLRTIAIKTSKGTSISQTEFKINAMRPRLRFPGLCMIMFVLLGCYPDGPDYVNDLDLVVTRYDKAFKFQEMKTYAIPDFVVKITGNLAQGDQVEVIDDEYSKLIVDAVRSNLDFYGWEETDAVNADVVIFPTAISTTTFVWYYDWWYWDWWYPWDSWGWYYPYDIYGNSYTSGSVFLQLTYHDGQTAADNIPVPWAAVLNGLLEGNRSEVDTRIERGIDQAFQQSPFLDLKK